MATRWTVGILSLISALIIAPVVIVAAQSTADTLSIQRMTLRGTSDTLPGSLTGMMTFNTGSRSIGWNLFLISPNISFASFTLGIFGPSTSTPNVLYVPLCGGATTIVCVANGTATQVMPQGFSLVPYITAIRQFPMWYDVKLCDPLDNCYVAPLGISAGTP